LITRYFDDIQVGEKSVTRSRTITEADIVNFASLSGDWYPLHCDAEYAKKSPFGDRIAHGLLILSAASGLTPLEPGPVLAFYGMVCRSGQDWRHHPGGNGHCRQGRKK